MKIPFCKYQGTGNDFILIDNRSLQWNPSQKEVEFLCDRRFGIGADGLMLLSDSPGYDFAMIYYNSDGNESTMCGNGGRCISAYAHSLGLTENIARFMAVDGSHESHILSSNHDVWCISLKMKDTEIGQQFPDGIFIDTGSPHFVKLVARVQELDVFSEGRRIRYENRFGTGGTNVDFTEETPEGLYVRTYERGVENETLSCGTGVTAAALVSGFLNHISVGKNEIRTPGGVLTVRFTRNERQFSNVWLEGEAKAVFHGEIELPAPSC